MLVDEVVEVWQDRRYIWYKMNKLGDCQDDNSLDDRLTKVAAGER